MAYAIKKLGLIAGNGWLPVAIIAHCQQQNIPFVILAIAGQTPDDLIQQHPHQWIKFATISHTFNIMEQEGCSHVMMAGGMKRPRLSTLRPDKRGLKLLGRLGLNIGDDTLLKAVTAEIESAGFQVIGAHELLKDLLLPAEVLTKQQPTTQQWQDVVLGFQIAKQIGALDIGQAVLIEEGRVLAVENVAGTAAMLQAMQPYAKNAVLVKCAKPQQEQRADLPSLGLETIEQAHQCGISLIAGEAGKTLLLQSVETIKAAKNYGIILLGHSFST